MNRITRREFLRLSLAGLGVTAAVAGGYHFLGPERLPDDGTAATYYGARQEKFLQEFSATLEYLRTALAAHYTPAFADTIVAETLPLAGTLMLAVPYIGGDANELTSNLVQSAGALAYYQVMKTHGKPLPEIGQILYEGFDAQMAATPGLVSGFMGAAQSLGLTGQQVKHDAVISQQRQYPEDWVFTYVAGDGVAFDWGVDYTECGVCKFYHAQGADEFTPYLCQLDFPISRAFKMGLQRTETLAQGGRRCDFRYKAGRETPSGWPPPFWKDEG